MLATYFSNRRGLGQYLKQVTVPGFLSDTKDNQTQQSKLYEGLTHFLKKATVAGFPSDIQNNARPLM